MFLYAFYRRYIWLLRIIALFFMGLGVTIIVALHQMNLETLRGNILNGLRDATNMPIEIDGDISWKFSLRPEIELNNVRIPNADWAKNKNLFVADKIDVRLDLFSLFRKKPVIRYIKIVDAKINLEKNAKGKNSVVFNETDNDEVNENESEDKEPEFIKYPFKPLPFSGLEIQKLTVNIYGDKYSLASFGVHNYLHDDVFEYSGSFKPY
ncbi:MAG: AsmA family protein [Alphaproteobacteria bacterium]|nr:AsmA family protein [Alphaproteobacteria bacterium]